MLIPTVNHNYIAGYDPERHLLPEDIDHTDLQNVGTTSHADIDLHIGSEVNPHNVGMSQLSNQDTGAIQFDLDNTITPAVGELRWNDDIGTLQLGMPGEHVVLDIGREELIKVGNDEGSLITDGSAVYISDSQGNKPVVKLARADSLSTARVIGLATEDIATGGFNGFVCSRGMVRGVNTTSAGIANGETWVEGDVVYLSAANAGKLTNVMPEAPNYAQRVGIVTNVHQTQGSIYIHIEHSTSITELADVDGTPLDTNGQILVWDNDNKYFDPAYNIEDFVPYTGADKDLDLGVYNLSASSLLVKSGPGVFESSPEGDICGGYSYNEFSTISSGDGTSQVAGCFSFGYAQEGNILSMNKGSFAQGYAGFFSFIQARGIGSFAQGDCQSDTVIQSTNRGSFAQGTGGFGQILSSGQASFVQGFASCSNITSSGQASFVQGFASFSNITSSGQASFAQGFAEIYNITSSAGGSFAQGYTDDLTYTEGIIASAKNAVQFGPGTNAIADNLQVGTGLSLYGKPSTPPTLRNGMIWQDGTALYIRLNDTTYTVNLTEVI